MADVVPLPRRGGKCPICGKPAVPELRPFCSKRCADLDLARWFGGAYRIETDEPAEADPAPRPDDDR